jgi:hypothetical protein
MSEHAVIVGRLVTIDKKTAACAVLRTGSYPNSLAFVPVGTVLSDREALVGYVNDAYVLIDPDTGMVSGIGNLNAPARESVMSSGDIVSIDRRAAAYVTIIPKGSVTADPAAIGSPRSIPRPAPSKRSSAPPAPPGLFGARLLGRDRLRFSSSGLLVKIDLTSGAGTPIPITGARRRVFYGAGTTTVAPIVVE